MKSREEFRLFYNTELVPKLGALEAKRKKISFGILITLLIIAIPMALLIITKLFLLLPVGIFIYIVIHLVFFKKKINELTKEFKLEIIKNMVTFFDESLSYAPNQSITQSEYLESTLFLKGIDRYTGDDLVSGKLDKTNIKFSEVHTEYESTETDDDGNESSTWHTIFRGIFLIADFNKHFNGRTVVSPDITEQIFGKLIGNALERTISGGSLVIMEDIEFEKLFCVHSTDQIEARYILSPRLMERIVSLKNKSKKTIYLSFVNSKLFIAISIGKNLFEPPIFSSLLNPKLIDEFFEYLYLSIGIVEELDLNTRIWTRE